MTDLLYDAVARIARHEATARTWASIGVVTEVHDSVLLGDDYAVSVRLRDTGIVAPRLPVVVGALGFAATPTVGDVVLVVFADGDRHGGLVVGRLYHRDLAPPPHGAGQLVLQLPPGSDAPDIDAKLDPGTPELTLTVGETTVAITGKTVEITIGDATLTIDGQSPAKAELAVGDSTLQLDANGNVSVRAANTLELKADGRIVIESAGTVSISGALVEVN